MLHSNYRNILILSIILIIVMITPNFSYASVNFGLGDLNQYKNEANISAIQDEVNGLLGIISAVGTSVSVIALMAIGIKYMMGSVEEKSQYKETFKPYIIGAFLLFSVSIVPQIIYSLLENFH